MNRQPTPRSLVLAIVVTALATGCASSPNDSEAQAKTCGKLPIDAAAFATRLNMANRCMRNAWGKHQAAKLEITGSSVEGDAFRITFRVRSDQTVTYSNTNSNTASNDSGPVLLCDTKVWLRTGNCRDGP